MINKIEEIQFNAWPALKSRLYDGWLLRISEGVTRRSNSISPIYSSALDINEKINLCEKLYRDNGLPVIFKLTKDVYPPELDKVLENRGYAYDAETSVQLLDLSTVDINRDTSVKISDTASSEWFDHFINYNGYDRHKTEAYQHIIKKISLKTCFADIYLDDKHAGCGLGVVEDDYLGLFDIVVKPGYRNHGLGYRLVNSIIAWGRDAGAKTAYLQVMTDNPPALNLYEKLGFRELYRYWYRVKK